jgi:VWFA-related protein
MACVASVVLTCALAAPAASPAAQETAGRKDAAAPPVFRAGTQLVVLDVVARDKKGQTVRDLRAEDFEVLEEGAPRPVQGFRFVEAAAPAASAAPMPAPQAEAPRNPTLVTLVFDALGPEGRVLARKAGLELLALRDRPDLLFSVFVVGNRLRLLQQFTSDRPALRAAVDRACVSLDPRGQVPDAAAVDRAAQGAQATADAADQATAGSSGGGAAGAQATVAAQFANMELRAVRMAEDLERDVRGNASLFGLFALARQQQRLAGRKAIVYFSEGLQVPVPLEQMFRSVVSEANRANLSVYSVDARGLRSTSDLDRARTDIRDSAENVRRQVQSRGGRAVTREDAVAPEVAEAAIHLDVQGMLEALSADTGGRLIANSNDVHAGLERVMDDMSGYYEITYDPQLAEFDGSFRRIELKVHRPGVRVQTRSGYFALPPGEGAVNFPWELALARALRATPVARDFDLHAAAYRFGVEAEGVRYTLVAEFPLGSLSFEEKGGTRRAHFSLMAVVRDAAGAVQERFSQDSPVEVKERDLEALRRGNAVFTRTFRLAPGRYALELVAFDQRAGKASVRKSVLIVAPRSALPSLSSLAVVRRLEPVAEGTPGSADPMRFGGKRIVPFVSEPTLRAGDAVSLFFVAYAHPGTEPQVTVEVRRDGATVSRSPVALPSADGEGRVPYVATFSTRGLRAGRYEVAALAGQGEAATEERTFFTVATD